MRALCRHRGGAAAVRAARLHLCSALLLATMATAGVEVATAQPLPVALRAALGARWAQERRGAGANPISVATATAVPHEPTRERVVVLTCFAGAAPALEVVTLLKSALANAPRVAALEVVIAGDSEAIASVEAALTSQAREWEVALEGSAWAAPVTLRLVDVSARVAAWEAHLLANVSSGIARRGTFGDPEHSALNAERMAAGMEQGAAPPGIGNWYRYFADEILPPDAGYDWALYVDTDTIFVSSPVAVWRQRDLSLRPEPGVFFQWDDKQCSGVLLMHVSAFREGRLWDVAKRAIRAEFAAEFDANETKPAVWWKHLRDQRMVGILQKRAPEVFGSVPRLGWAVSLADGGAHFGSRMPFRVQRATVLHFNGKRGHVYGREEVNASWGVMPGWNLVQHFQRLPWGWLLHGAELAASEASEVHRLRVVREALPR